MNFLELNGIEKQYHKTMALSNISFTIMKGDILGLLGENGAGKSTLLSIISTVIKPNKGMLFYKEKDIIKNPQYLRKELGYVPQEIALYSMLSGKDNLLYFGGLYGIKKSELKQRIEKIRNMICFTNAQLEQPINCYSGGMKRRLNIAVALLPNPTLLLLDEPTVGIDIISKNYILETLKQLGEEGTTILYSSHYFDEIEKICNKICVIKEGTLLQQENLSTILQKETLEQYYLKLYC